MRSLFSGAALFLLGMIAAASPSWSEPLRIYAAGSLTAAITEMVQHFPAPPDDVAAPVFGPSGLLRERIEKGAAADLLASADMAQPRALAAEKPGRPVILFTRNRLCALGRDGLGLTPDNVLDRLLDPKVRLATSTPGADPAGDYAWAVFARAEALHTGAQTILQGKAMKLVGGPNTPPLVPGKGAVQGIFLSNSADVFLSYCSGSAAVMQDVPGLTSVALPEALSVGADYGMVVLSDQPAAADFALFVMSEAGQVILQRHGFDPVGIASRHNVP